MAAYLSHAVSKPLVPDRRSPFGNGLEYKSAQPQAQPFLIESVVEDLEVDMYTRVLVCLWAFMVCCIHAAAIDKSQVLAQLRKNGACVSVPSQLSRFIIIETGKFEKANLTVLVYCTRIFSPGQSPLQPSHRP